MKNSGGDERRVSGMPGTAIWQERHGPTNVYLVEAFIRKGKWLAEAAHPSERGEKESSSHKPRNCPLP